MQRIYWPKRHREKTKKKKLLTKINKDKEYRRSHFTEKRKKQREPEEVRQKEKEDIERESQE